MRIDPTPRDISIHANGAEQLGAIDLAKFIGAILVVMIHSPPFKTVSSMLHRIFNNGICNLAVPFFFVASGYLVFRRAKRFPQDNDIVYHHVKRLLRHYLFWTAIYIPAIVYFGTLRDERGLLHGAAKTVLDIIFTDPWGPLWYVHASIIAMAVLTALLDLGIDIRWILGVSGILYLTDALAINSDVLIIKQALSTMGSIVTAIAYISIGIVFAYFPLRMPYGFVIPGLGASLVGMLAVKSSVGGG